MSLYSDTVLGDNPIAYWRFDDVPDKNFIIDSSFESGSLVNTQKFWDLGTPAEFTYVTGKDDFVTGTAGLKVTTTRTSAGWNTCQVHTGLTVNGNTDLFPVVVGEEYFASCWFKQTAGAKATHFKVVWFTSAGNQVSASFVFGATDGLFPWNYRSSGSTLIVPATAAYAQIILMYGYWDGVTGTNAQIWFDNIQFSPMTTYRAIAPGYSQPLPSPGFEGNNLVWVNNSVGSGARSFDGTNPHSGTTALKLTNPSAGNYGGTYNQVGIPLLGVTSVKVSAWVKGTSAGTTGPLRVVLAGPGAEVSNSGYATAQPSTQAGVSVTDLNPVITNSYAQYTNTIDNIGQQYRWLFVEIYANGNGATGPVFWDDLIVMLSPSTVFSNGFDGRNAGTGAELGTGVGATNDGDGYINLNTGDGNSTAGYLLLPPGSVDSIFQSHDFSVECWAYWQSTNSDQPIFGAGPGGVGGQGMHFVTRSGNLYMGFYSDDLSTSVAPTLNHWHHVVFTFISSSKARVIYLDGIAVASGTSASQPAIPNNSSAYWGREFAGNGAMCGNLDDGAIYNYALSANQVSTHFAAASIPWSSNPTDFHITGNNVTTLLDTIDVATTETYPYQVDVSNYLAPGDTISSISQTLVNAATSQSAPTGWQGTIVISNNVITVPVTCSFLSKKNQYQLATTFTANWNKTLTFTTLINVVA